MAKNNSPKYNIESHNTSQLDYAIENPQWNEIWSQILILPKEEIKKHLTARKLRTDGHLSQQKSRLFKFIKGDWDPLEFNSELSNKLIKHYQNMSDKIPFCKPIKFSGNIHENIDNFIKKYNKASTINGWTTDQKKLFLTIYLEDTASTFLENFESKNPEASWEQTEQALRLEFEPTVQIHMLRTMLEKRKQLSDESIASYINDIENLCRRIDPNMSQSELAHTILKGLKPEIARYVGILDNNNVKELKNNIKKYESIEFILNGKTIQSSDEIRTQITREHINTIDNNKNHKQKIDELTSQVNKLEKLIKNLDFNKNKWTTNPNNYNLRNNFNRYDRKLFSNTNRYNNNYNSRNNYYKNYESNGRENNNFNKIKQQSYYNKTNMMHPNNHKENFNNRNFERRTECEHCHKYNHKSSDCKWKLTCSICNKRYHTEDNCYTKNQKNI